jgi:hypothetical protein
LISPKQLIFPSMRTKDLTEIVDPPCAKSVIDIACTDPTLTNPLQEVAAPMRIKVRTEIVLPKLICEKMEVVSWSRTQERSDIELP